MMLQVIERPHVFVSCGQQSESEKELGSRIKNLVEAELPGVSALYAQRTNSLDSLSRNVLRAIEECVGFIAVLHPRGIVTGSHPSTIRGSVWVEQEIAIAAARAQRIGLLPVAVFAHEDIQREGLRAYLHLNETFRNDAEVVKRLRDMLRSREFSILKPPTTRREIRQRSSRLGFGTAMGNFEHAHVAVKMLAEGDTRATEEPISDQFFVELSTFVKNLPGFDRMNGIHRIDEMFFAPALEYEGDFYQADKALLVQDWGDVSVRTNVHGDDVFADLCLISAVGYAIAGFVERHHGTDCFLGFTVAYRSALPPATLAAEVRYADHNVSHRGEVDLGKSAFAEAFRIPIQRAMLEIKREASAELVSRSLRAAWETVESLTDR